MAATFLVPPTFTVLFTCLVISGTTYADESHCYKQNAYFYAIRKGIGIFCASGFYARVPVRLQLSLHGFHKSRLPRCLWTIHRYTSLLMPGHNPPQDITKFMDLSLNPGPDLTGGWLLHNQFSTLWHEVLHVCSLPSPFLSEDILERFSAFATPTANPSNTNEAILKQSDLPDHVGEAKNTSFPLIHALTTFLWPSS